MNKGIYKAFTLIEMLIVMGILVVLIVIGVAAGKYSLDQSNEVGHKNGATQIYQAAQSHYTDYGEFPGDEISIQAMVATGGPLDGYLNSATFQGGSEATYYYYTNDSRQAVVICVSLGGRADVNKKGIACVGNGFGDPTMTAPAGMIPFAKEKLDPVKDKIIYSEILEQDSRIDWDGEKWVEPIEVPGGEGNTIPADPCAPCDEADIACITGRPESCDSEDDEEEQCAPCKGENCLSVEPPVICCDLCEVGDPDCLRPSNCPPTEVVPYDPSTDPCSASCVETKDIKCLDVMSPACM